jgi:Type II secretion system (T2SS), protein E, N-terminal domain
MDFELQTSRSRISDWNLSKREPGAPKNHQSDLREPRFFEDLRLSRSTKCENPECPFRNPLRKFLLRRARQGVLLQGRWYCSVSCFEQAILAVYSELIKIPDQPLTRPQRIPLGLLLLGRGIINEDELKAALLAQKEQGTGRLGRWLVQLGSVSTHDVSTALAAQWGCAVFPLENDTRYRDCAQMLPLVLLESSRMLPVHYLAGTHWLFLGFSEDIDRTTIYSIERLLDSRTEPCVVSESAMDLALDEIRRKSRPREILFESPFSAAETARTIRDYALKLGAEELVLARPRGFLWVRLRASGVDWDLLFRVSSRDLVHSGT